MKMQNKRDESIEFTACIEGTWRLYDLCTNCQIDNLNLDQVRALLSSMTYERYRDWVCWDASHLEWRSLTYFSELRNALPAFDSANTAVPEAIIVEKDEREVSQVTESAPGAETVICSELERHSQRRRYKRWPVCVSVELSSENYKVWTSTVDVSLGGLRFQERIPKRFDGLFRARITKGGQTVEVNCFALWDEKSSESFRAKVADDADNDKMQKLITTILGLANSREELLLA